MNGVARGLVRGIALPLASVILALGLAEIGLRVAGFRFHLGPEKVQHGWRDPLEQIYRSDPDLLWVRTSYDETLAAARQNQPLDIVFLGDSCTEYGSYDERVIARLQTEREGATLRWETLGFGGWSSYQGMRQLERDVVPLQPRVATFYFGWNDHWINRGFEDKALRPASETLFGLGASRLGQLWLKVRLGLRTPDAGQKRVTPEDFRDNLRRIVRTSRAHDIYPVLLTAPTSHRRGHEPEKLVPNWLSNLDELVPLHQQYVAIVREVAEAEGARLCDLARRFEAIPADVLTDQYFLPDGIHLRPEGDDKLAQFLYECFRESPEIRALWKLPAP